MRLVRLTQSIGLRGSSVEPCAVVSLGIANRILHEPAARMRVGDLVSFSDLCCLVDAHRHGQSLARDPRLITRLRAIIGGGLTLWDDARAERARDFQFELATAVELLECGAEFSGAMDHKAVDVECFISGVPVLVECKRIRAVENLWRRVCEGLEQIELRRTQVDGIGMVFVDVSLTSSKRGEMVTCGNSAEVSRIAQPLLRQQADHFADALREFGDRRFGGVIAMSSTQFHVPAQGVVEFRGWIGIDNPRARPAARLIYRELASRVGERSM